MITVESFLELENYPECLSGGTLAQALKDFATLHCEAQAEAIKEHAKVIDHIPSVEDDRLYKMVCPKSIDNAYPIKDIS